MIYKPHNYQKFTIEHILQNRACGLFLDMGMGKTSSTLTALERLMFDTFEVEKPLIIAPKRVAEDTWSGEIDKWDHLKHLTISKILGSERQRIEAMRAKADIYVINRENVAWLISFFGGSFPFDAIVIDELSSFKNAKSIRFKALRAIMPKVKRVIGLTGTPAPKGLIDLWAQLYLLDQGERLGKTLTSYREKYFSIGAHKGHVVFEYKLKTEKEQEIYEKIGDICVSMKSRDYLDLPECIDTIKWVTLSPPLMKQYYEFEKNLILEMPSIDDISVANAAALTNKLRQFTNGAVYDSDHNYHEIHTEKLEALEEEIEAANGKPVLVFYQYKHDVDRILKKFKSMKPVLLKGSEDIAKWNAGEISLLVTHAASAGHGLNMQYGGHITIWYGVDWDLEKYLQGRARLGERQGQTHVATNSRIIAKGTIDEDVLASLEAKGNVQDGVMNALKARINKYKLKQ